MVMQASAFDTRLEPDALRLHAVKNCAASISVLCRLLAKSGTAEPRHLDRLQDAATRMTALLRNALEQPADPLDVSELLRFVQQEAEPKAQDGQVELLFSHGAASVRRSAPELAEALLNLVDNAIEVTRPGGHVRVVHTTDDAGTQCFAISDEGPGMSPELTRDAGRRPVRSSKPNGSGVGLVLARRVVESQGGHLDVVSSTEGTTVRVMLPAA